jgi:hypothetical protein
MPSFGAFFVRTNACCVPASTLHGASKLLFGSLVECQDRFKLLIYKVYFLQQAYFQTGQPAKAQRDPR